MGNAESTNWDRYVPPGQEGHDDQQQARAKSNKADNKTKANAGDSKTNQKTKSDADGIQQPQAKPKKTDVKPDAVEKEKPQPKPKKTDAKTDAGKDQPQAKANNNDDKEKKKPKTEKQSSSKKVKIKNDKDHESDTENVEETERNDGIRKPRMIRGVGHVNYDDEPEYDPLVNFLKKRDLNKEWSEVTDVYIDDVGPQVMIRKKPLRPRWKPKTSVESEHHDTQLVTVPMRENLSKQFLDQNTGRISGPVSKPQMKIGDLEFMMGKTDKYSMHGNFVLDPVKTNGNFMT